MPRPPCAARARRLEAARHEYNRLLYVALTRARSRLIVCGTAATSEERRHAGDSGRLLVQADRRHIARPFATRSPQKTATARSGASGNRRCRKSPRQSREPRRNEKSGMAHATGRGRRRPRHRHHAVRLIRRTMRVMRPRLVARPRKRTAARHTGAPADAVASRHRARIPRRGGEALSRARRERSSTRTNATKSPRRFSRFSTIRHSQPLFAPGSRAEVPIVGRLGTRRLSPDRWTGWP